MTTQTNRVNELSSCTITVDFVDEAGDAVVPTAAQYCVIDLKSGDEIVAEEEVSSLASSVDIEIPDDANALVGDGGDEIHVLALTFQYGTGKQGTADYKFLVKDLSAHPFPVSD